MSSSWTGLFHKIAKGAPGTCALWKMKNGADFHMIIPRDDLIMDDSFAEPIGLPFTFDEIDFLLVPPVVDAGKHSFVNNVDVVRNLVSDVDGITCTAESDGLRIAAR